MKRMLFLAVTALAASTAFRKNQDQEGAAPGGEEMAGEAGLEGSTYAPTDAGSTGADAGSTQAAETASGSEGSEAGVGTGNESAAASNETVQPGQQVTGNEYASDEKVAENGTASGGEGLE